MLKTILLVGSGGFIGSCGRYFISKWLNHSFNGSFPVGTFMVNIIGCFLIGLIMGVLEKNNLLNSSENLLLITGFCGGFTTFSTFANDMLKLSDKGEWLPLILYTAASVCCGLLLVWVGRILGMRVCF